MEGHPFIAAAHEEHTRCAARLLIRPHTPARPG